MTADPVRISYNTLLSDPASAAPAINAALGNAPGSLGIILIGDLPPEFPAARERLFRLAREFARLPEEQRESCARPETSYFFGWSHGKEVMNGKPDTAKGSYYANPLLDRPEVSDAQRKQHPEYFSGNVWPALAGMEDFEPAFKALGRVVADVGLALASACEGFVQHSQGIHSLISKSQSNKARLLHYYPQTGRGGDDACGTHIDHSLLTGLCAAMYFDDITGERVPPPGGDAGLFIYPRGAKEETLPVKASIPEDCLAFQTGEAIELLTGGKLRATWHYVSAGSGGEAVSRETFAFFLQPDVDDVISPEGETFGQFTKRIIARHYGEDSQAEGGN